MDHIFVSACLDSRLVRLSATSPIGWYQSLINVSIRREILAVTLSDLSRSHVLWRGGGGGGGGGGAARVATPNDCEAPMNC